jgi:hypothetical protein
MPSTSKSEQQTRAAGDEERRAPAELRVHEAAQDVAQRRADGDGGVEEREDAAAAILREVVGEQRRGDRRVGRLPDADGGAGGEEAEEAVREAAEHRRHAPDRDAEGDQPRPGALIAQRAEHRRGEHVDDHEAGHQEAGAGVGQLELGHLAQALDERRDDVAVEVVEEVDEGEDQQPVARAPSERSAGVGGGGQVHGSGSTVTRHRRASARELQWVSRATA